MAPQGVRLNLAFIAVSHAGPRTDTVKRNNGCADVSVCECARLARLRPSALRNRRLTKAIKIHEHFVCVFRQDRELPVTAFCTSKLNDWAREKITEQPVGLTIIRWNTATRKTSM